MAEWVENKMIGEVNSKQGAAVTGGGAGVRDMMNSGGTVVNGASGGASVYGCWEWCYGRRHRRRFRSCWKLWMLRLAWRGVERHWSKRQAVTGYGDRGKMADLGLLEGGRMWRRRSDCGTGLKGSGAGVWNGQRHGEDGR